MSHYIFSLSLSHINFIYFDNWVDVPRQQLITLIIKMVPPPTTTADQGQQSHEDQEALIDTLQAMHIQEELSYRCYNCYQEMEVQQQADSAIKGPASPSPEVVTMQTRTILCDWSNKIIDFCDLDRETVEIAFSYVDRFVQTDDGYRVLQNSNEYQLLVVTALYVAIKVHETVAISAAQFEKISRNMFTAQDVEEMEHILLQGLGWHLHPPTSLCFVRLFLELMPSESMTQDQKDTAFILAKIQTELSVRDCALVSVNASTIAFASLLNAFEALGMLESMNGSAAVNSFLSMVASHNLVCKSVLFDTEALLIPIQARLYQAIAKQSDVTLFTAPLAPSTPPRKGGRPNKACETTPRSVMGRTA